MRYKNLRCLGDTEFSKLNYDNELLASDQIQISQKKCECVNLGQ